MYILHPSICKVYVLHRCQIIHVKKVKEQLIGKMKAILDLVYKVSFIRPRIK